MAVPARAALVPPLQHYGDMFVDVQMQPLFADGKTFADARPRRLSPPALRTLYAAQKSQPGFSLAGFVTEHFEIDNPAAPTAPTAQTGHHRPRRPLHEHIRRLWPLLLRAAPANGPPGGSLLPLPQAYVVPGGRFRECYYWDSYFTLLGLVQDGRRDLAQAMLDNTAHQIDTLGHAPNGNRSYLASRSQPPFFHLMVKRVSRLPAAAAWAQYLPQLQQEHAYWMAGEATLAAGQAALHLVRLPDGSLLNRYADAAEGPREESYREDVLTAAATQRPAEEVWRDLRAAAESGWDFSSRWCAQPLDLSSIQTTQLLPVDLNSLLWSLERAIHQGCLHSGDSAGAQVFALRARQRRAAVRHWLWHDGLGHPVDCHWAEQQRAQVLTGAALLPLYVGLASAEQAHRTAQAVQAQLLRLHGLQATNTVSGQQWDAPNGWAPLQWLAVMGLRRYRHHALAQTIATRWLAMVERVYQHTGRLLEKYDVCADRSGGGGEYPTQDGFGWTNGVVLALAALYPAPRRAGLAHLKQPEANQRRDATPHKAKRASP